MAPWSPRKTWPNGRRRNARVFIGRFQMLPGLWLKKMVGVHPHTHQSKPSANDTLSSEQDTPVADDLLHPSGSSVALPIPGPSVTLRSAAVVSLSSTNAVATGSKDGTRDTSPPARHSLSIPQCIAKWGVQEADRKNVSVRPL